MDSQKRVPATAKETAEHQLPDNTNSVEWTRGFDNVVAYHLRRAQEASFAAFVRRVGDDHIWPGWYSLLMIIRDNPGINQTELSQATGRDKSTLTASLRELDKAGMVVRLRDEGDRRNFRIYLSENGENYLGELDAHAKNHDREIDRIVGNDKRDLFLSILKELAYRLD